MLKFYDSHYSKTLSKHWETPKIQVFVSRLNSVITNTRIEHDTTLITFAFHIFILYVLVIFLPFVILPDSLLLA